MLIKTSLRQLHLVAAAARKGSVSHSATAEGVSASSVLLAIDKFEFECKTKIFIRQRSKGLIVTRDGQKIIREVMDFLADAEHFIRSAMGSPGEEFSELHVATFTTLAPLHLSAVISGFVRAMPGVMVHVHSGDLREVHHFLRDGVADIALTYDLGVADEFAIKRLRLAPPYAILPADDPLAKKNRVSISDIAARPYILFDLPESRSYFEQLFTTHGVQLNIAYRIELWEMVRTMVAAGMGVSVLNMRPRYDVTYTGKRVACRYFVEEVQSPSISILQRKNHELSKRAQAFKKVCEEIIK